MKRSSADRGILLAEKAPHQRAPQTRTEQQGRGGVRIGACADAAKPLLGAQVSRELLEGAVRPDVLVLGHHRVGARGIHNVEVFEKSNRQISLGDLSRTPPSSARAIRV